MKPSPPSDRIRIGLTVGDPSGIGPEILRSALSSPDLPGDVDWVPVGDISPRSPGNPDAEGARIAWDALEEAARELLDGRLHGVVTGPVSKSGLQAIGFPFPGQTEFFAARANVSNFAMCLTSPRLTVALVTAHIPLRQVADQLSTSEIVRVGRLLADFTKAKFGIDRPRIAVAGLNPHAGEDGRLGGEEETLIGPAVALLQADSTARFEGPVSPDTLFYRAVSGEFDGVLCMYHDQGLIPLKMDGFDEGVNITLGLPFIRTSPDHGTAHGIAGKGIARADSMLAAMGLAAKLAAAR